ncbi:MAG: hypothetical protein HUU50_17660 [Candidatus Brocadiae bacterium]|nr:hypothetical protein [Candidatus Brocadiia bacterium]
MDNFNPFKQNGSSQNASQTKEQVRDPLDVRELLTDNTKKAVITPNGELKVKGGNMKEKAGVELMKERYWGNASPYQAMLDDRISTESRAVREYFPSFEMRKASKPFQKNGWNIAQPGEMFWTGTVRTHSGTEYMIAVVYPRDYPFSEIKSYVLSPYIPASEHRFQDGHLCLYDHDGKGQGYEHGKSTAVTMIAWTAAWLHSYEIWRSTGKWPLLKET